MDLAGKPGTALTVNGAIPGPVLRFTEGDTAVIRVPNAMDVPSSIHWHGILVPNDMDGVPSVTFPGIAAGTTLTSSFPIRQNGTYWYQSHTMLQEQKGVYGSIVILPKSGGVDPGHVVMCQIGRTRIRWNASATSAVAPSFPASRSTRPRASSAR